MGAQSYLPDPGEVLNQNSHDDAEGKKSKEQG